MTYLPFSVYQCSLVPEDFLWFVSREFNTLTNMQPVIHNYALSFALGQSFIIVATDNVPNYSFLETLDNYATPAAPVEPPEFATHTYNSVCSKTNLTQSSFNIPALGKNRKISPSSTEFRFIVFSKNNHIPNYIRIGKKSCIAKVVARKLHLLETIDEPKDTIDVEIYYNLHDISPNDIVTKADLLLMYPTPIARSMKIKAPYLVLEDDDNIIKVPIPRHLRCS